jgi:tRNA-dihydrouridine synthase B
MRESGCDGIMIGREAVKSPWIFRQCAAVTAGTRAEMEVDIRKIFLQVLDDIGKFLPEKLHKSRGRRFSFYFSKNAKFGHELYKSICRAESIDMMKKAVEGYFERNPGEILKKSLPE